MIVHYTLGIYPIRIGGLNKYATDLMREQRKKMEVVALMPGPWRPWKRGCYIKEKRTKDTVRQFVMYNVHPLPLFYGIKTPSDFMDKHIDKDSFESFFAEVQPKVLHLHTLMGLPEEVLSFFKDKGVRIIYTSHDYFGICPKVNLINRSGVLCDGPLAERCVSCNASAPSTLFLRLRNSNIVLKSKDILRWLKNTFNS